MAVPTPSFDSYLISRLYVPHSPQPFSAAWPTTLPLEPIYRTLTRAVIGLVRSSLQVDHGASVFGNIFKFDAGRTAAASSVLALTYQEHISRPLHARLCIIFKLHQRMRRYKPVSVLWLDLLIRFGDWTIYRS
jgi:hypothetical protein